VILSTARGLFATAIPLIEAQGITLVGVTLGKPHRSRDPARPAVERRPAGALDATIRRRPRALRYRLHHARRAARSRRRHRRPAASRLMRARSHSEGVARLAPTEGSVVPASAARLPEADVHVIVVIRQRLDDPPRSVEGEMRPGEDVPRPRGDEPIHEVLGEVLVDQLGAIRLLLERVEPRVVDVGVEAVLVRGMSQAAVLGPNGPPRGRERSPIPTRGAQGCAARYSEITRNRVRMSREVPQRRHSRFGDMR
jgi:hypothetical protein